MPRRGALRGARPLRWSVDLSPAEFAYVEQARAVLRNSRAEFVVSYATDLQERVGSKAKALAEARTVLDAETMLLEEEDDARGRDNFGRGGRRPAVRVFSADDIAKIHAVVRRQRGSSERLKELLTEDSEDEEAGD